MILTIRSDNLSLLQGHTESGATPRLPHDLPRFSQATFKEIIEGAARLGDGKGTFDPELTETLIEEFEGLDALPLLAITLERLRRDDLPPRFAPRRVH